MKAMKKSELLTLIILTVSAGLFIQCSSQKVGPVEPSRIDMEIQQFATGGGSRTITGLIRDFKSDLAVAGATVTVIDTTDGRTLVVGSGISDATGKYIIPGVPVDTLLVHFTKDGYMSVTLTAFVQPYYWSVNLKTASLIPVSGQTVIGPSGGVVQDTDDEGDVITLSIPAGALTADIGISLTHLQGREIPGLPPDGHLSFATVHVGPEGTVFQTPVTLTVPLPAPMTPGTPMPVYQPEPSSLIRWQDAGIQAVVDPDGLTASAPISRSGLYSVMPEIRIDESASQILWEQYLVLPSSRGYYTVTYKNQWNNSAPEYVDFPDGAEDVSHSTLIYMFEQYYGAPFTVPEMETIFYESPTGFYAYQIIRIRSIAGEMTLPGPIGGESFRIYIKRPLVRFVPHDQGCGY
jgi:hypothetical protein